MTLKESMTAEGAALVSPFGGVCLLASLFGSNLIHIHRPHPDEQDDDINGEFWRRHRHMDNVLVNIQLSLPSHFRLPAGIEDPNVVFTNMNIATSTICLLPPLAGQCTQPDSCIGLHQAAIYKAEKHRMPSSISAESKIRCITAAAQITSIMRMVCHLDLSGVREGLSLNLECCTHTQCLDESVYCILPLRRRSSFRAILEVTARRRASSGISAVPAHRHGTHEEEEPLDRVIFGAVGR